jgi:uncharacterized membrane protein (DUF106 family)
MKKYYELEEDVIKELERNRQRIATSKRSICPRLFSETIYTLTTECPFYFWLFYPSEIYSHSQERK